VNITIPPALITHRFSTANSRRFISLRDEFVALAETNYEKWELFIDEVRRMESALQEIYKPAFYSRIGLRYRDIISRSELKLTRVGWQDLLKPYFLAELGDKDVAGTISRIQTRTTFKIPRIPDAQITLRHGLITKKENNEQCYLIDADFSAERKEGVNEPFEILDRFNVLAGRLFRWAIQKRLHDAMEPRAI
jgi:uncharacterized protein (TIGR04255 family)